MSGVVWRQDRVAGVPLQRYIGSIGSIEVGNISFDGSNGFWIWASPLQEDAWGYGATEDAARRAFELWLRNWLENFRDFLDSPS